MMISYIKYIIVLICVYCSCLSLGYTFFEHMYQCTLSGTTIDVGLKIQDHSNNCMQVINFLYDKEQAYYEQLTIVQDYVGGSDQAYRSGIQAGIQKNYHTTVRLKEKFIDVVQQFEQELFDKVKKVILYKLNQEFTKLYHQHTTTADLLKDMIQHGTSKDFVYTQETYKQQIIRLAIRDGLKKSKEFASLIAYLQLYKQTSTLLP